jgi:hypothetical protein
LRFVFGVWIVTAQYQGVDLAQLDLDCSTFFQGGIWLLQRIGIAYQSRTSPEKIADIDGWHRGGFAVACVTVISRDADGEPPWMGSRRVTQATAKTPPPLLNQLLNQETQFQFALPVYVCAHKPDKAARSIFTQNPSAADV